MTKKRIKYIIGIDEAWRGSWAWPVSAWVFCVPLDFDFSIFPGLTDSKKLTPKKRETLFQSIEKNWLKWICIFAYAESSSEIIDQVGIREANRLAMEAALKKALWQICWNSEDSIFESLQEIRIDGRDNYQFPWIPKEMVRYIVRWDLTEKVISAASIVAKVKRDRRMCDFSLEYPHYWFSLHKGYGTKKHYESLLYYGILPIHRKSYAPVKTLISLEA